MSLQDKKLTAFQKSIKQLSDTPSQDGITAAQLKELFDSRTDNEIKTQHNALIDYLATLGAEKMLVSQDTDQLKFMRLNGHKVLETSVDGSNWEATGSSGHVIMDNFGKQLPQRSVLAFKNSTVTDTNGVTVVEGITGAKGSKGDTGAQGGQGDKGVKGDQGDIGLSIVPHVDPSTGMMSFSIGTAATTPNAVFVRGPQGLQGVQGLQGLPGSVGMQGLQGPIGPQGIQGEQGRAGVAGSQGAQGIAGSQGSQGPQGARGDDGADGRSFVIQARFDSLHELQTKHPVGVVGQAFAVGSAANNHIYIWSDVTATWDNIGQLQGPMGPQGLQGVQGPIGPKGEQGEVGDRGQQGIQGVQGIQGPIGVQGEVGPQGIAGRDGQTGPAGPRGETGPIGLTGQLLPADKAKIDSVAFNANNYTHPALHEPSVIAQNSNYRFVTDAQTAVWDGMLPRVANFTNMRVARDLASFTSSAKQTGALVIRFPYSWNNTMHTIRIRGYSYQRGCFWEVDLSGFNNATTGAWEECSATCVTKRMPDDIIRFGYYGGTCCIVLGTTSTNWETSQVHIDKVVASFSGANSFTENGWKLELVTSSSGFTYSGGTHYGNTSTSNGLLRVTWNDCAVIDGISIPDLSKSPKYCKTDGTVYFKGLIAINTTAQFTSSVPWLPATFLPMRPISTLMRPNVTPSVIRMITLNVNGTITVSPAISGSDSIGFQHEFYLHFPAEK